MRRALTLTLCLAALLVFSPAGTQAQTWPGRVLISINGGVQAAAPTFDDDFRYDHPYTAGIPGEEAAVETTYAVPAGALFDIGGAVRLIGGLGAGLAVAQTNSTGDIEIQARIPHPFLLASHREVEGAVAARRSERSVHMQAVYVIRAARQLYLTLAGGPSYFDLEQRVVRTVSVSESFPFDEATFASADLEALDDSGWGFNVGADAAWMFNSNFGVGGVLRFARATLSVTPTGRDARDIDAGGVYVAAGARFSF